MFRLGHYGMVLLVYSVVGTALLARGYRDDALAGGVVMLLFTMHPDLDGDFSFVPHRQITHTVWFCFLIGLGCAVVVAADVLYRKRDLDEVRRPALWALSLGTLSGLTHLFADTLNPWGVMPFYPVSNVLITFDVVKASNLAANVALLAAGVLASLVAWRVGTARAPEPEPAPEPSGVPAESASEGPIGPFRTLYRRLVPADSER